MWIKKAKINRQELIDDLVDTLTDDSDDAVENFEKWLINGFKGLKNMSDEELSKYYKNIFEIEEEL